MADAQQIVDELVKALGVSEGDLVRLVVHDHEYAAAWRVRAEAAERSLEALTTAVAVMAIKYDAHRAGPSPVQWVEEVSRRLDAMRESAAQDAETWKRLREERDHYRELALAQPSQDGRVSALTGALAKLQKEHDALKEAHERLTNESRGALGGWWVPVEVQDDGVLPVPRLELAFAQIDGWQTYEVIYRLVYREFGGVLVGHPLSRCRKTTMTTRAPEADDLPWRFVPEASHDAGQLGGLPIYIIRPDMPPREQQPTAEQRARGIEHRRGECDASD